jgi:hypothetical protein
VLDDDDVVGEYFALSRVQGGEQRALAGRSATEHDPRPGAPKKGAAVEDLAAQPQGGDGRGRTEVRVDERVRVADLRDPECRHRRVPLDLDPPPARAFDQRTPRPEGDGRLRALLLHGRLRLRRLLEPPDRQEGPLGSHGQQQIFSSVEPVDAESVGAARVP